MNRDTYKLLAEKYEQVNNESFRQGEQALEGLGSVIDGLAHGAGKVIGNELRKYAASQGVTKQRIKLGSGDRPALNDRKLRLRDKPTKLKIGKHSDTEAKVDGKELALGLRTELEHTNDKAIAKQIALDHLAEDPRYYSKLKKAGL